MKKFLLHLAVFLFVFCTGMIFVYSMSPGVTPKKAESKEVKTSGKKSSSLTAAETSAVKVLPPLVLPEGMKGERSSEKGWEYTGEIKSNLVSARGRIVAAICHQGWTPDKKITLDETLSPREILTFTKEKYELILMLWKISGSATGFAYRREQQKDPIKEVIQ